MYIDMPMESFIQAVLVSEHGQIERTQRSASKPYIAAGR
jgi:hypothetical protein